MAHEELWQQLTALDNQTVAQRAKCQYLPAPPRYILTLLDTEYTVNLADKQIYPTPGSSEPNPAGYSEQLCLLAYLINAKDLPLADKLVKAESFPDGQFFFRGHHALPVEKLAKRFGQEPKLLYQAANKFNAEQCEFGDASIKLNALPQVPLTIVIWGGDEEFPSRASILFDQTASEQMPLDALGVAANLAVKAIIKTQ